MHDHAADPDKAGHARRAKGLAACVRRVERQNDVIRTMRANGSDTLLAEVLLGEFEKALLRALSNRDRLLAELQEPGEG